MNPSSKPSSLAIAVFAALPALLSACAGAQIPDAGRRRPDGVAIDPTSAPPAARDHANSADGLVTLRTPLGVDRARATVEELFRKIVVEDGDGLEPLFTRDAQAITTLAPGGGGPTPQAVLFWQGRFRKLDYTKLAGEALYRGDELTYFRAEDLIDSPVHPAIRVEALAGADVVVRVPIRAARLGADRFFGDEMILWLRRDGDRYRIFRVLEEFQLS